MRNLIFLTIAIVLVSLTTGCGLGSAGSFFSGDMSRAEANLVSRASDDAVLSTCQGLKNNLAITGEADDMKKVLIVASQEYSSEPEEYMNTDTLNFCNYYFDGKTTEDNMERILRGEQPHKDGLLVYLNANNCKSFAESSCSLVLRVDGENFALGPFKVDSKIVSEDIYKNPKFSVIKRQIIRFDGLDLVFEGILGNVRKVNSEGGLYFTNIPRT